MEYLNVNYFLYKFSEKISERQEDYSQRGILIDRTRIVLSHRGCEFKRKSKFSRIIIILFYSLGISP